MTGGLGHATFPCARALPRAAVHHHLAFGGDRHQPIELRVAQLEALRRRPALRTPKSDNRRSCRTGLRRLLSGIRPPHGLHVAVCRRSERRCRRRAPWNPGRPVHSRQVFGIPKWRSSNLAYPAVPNASVAANLPS
jgi:hypothetical protein